jgi:hypothetical protein
MNDLRRIDLDSPIKARSAPERIGRTIGIWFLAAFIISVMIGWFGFLGWGAVAMVRWLIN